MTDAGRPERASVVPFLRVRDARASAEWYARLGFAVDWEHRFEAGLPLFVALVRDGGRIFLSEPGDAPVNGLVYLYADPRELGCEHTLTDCGMVEAELVDPDGNRIRVGAPA